MNLIDILPLFLCDLRNIDKKPMDMDIDHMIRMKRVCIPWPKCCPEYPALHRMKLQSPSRSLVLSLQIIIISVLSVPLLTVHRNKTSTDSDVWSDECATLSHKNVLKICKYPPSRLQAEIPGYPSCSMNLIHPSRSLSLRYPLSYNLSVNSSWITWWHDVSCKMHQNLLKTRSTQKMAQCRRSTYSVKIREEISVNIQSAMHCYPFLFHWKFILKHFQSISHKMWWETIWIRHAICFRWCLECWLTFLSGFCSSEHPFVLTIFV